MHNFFEKFVAIMSKLVAYTASRIFDGDKWLRDCAILINDNKIREILNVADLPQEIKTVSLHNTIIAPAFIDLQIYGANRKLFAVYPEKKSLQLLTEHCRKAGTAYCLPAIATNTSDTFFRCIDAVKQYRDEGGKGILGLHIEGPWINPLKRGAHIESLIHSPDLKEVKELLEYGKGIIKMITLAPEVCSREIIELILSYNIIISAGHSNATHAEAMHGFQQGISSVTHLYNAMSGLHHREPGLVGAAFNHEKVMASIIPDGHHVNYEAIAIAKKIMGERLFAITDAVTETGEGYYQHTKAGDKYEAAGILSGSALTMNKALQNLVLHAGIELSEALRMCSLYPARVMKLDDNFGRIAKGHKAAMIVLDKELNVVSLIN